MGNRASDSVAGRQLTNKAANGDIALLSAREEDGGIEPPPPPRAVFGLVLRGSWRYLEHDWTAHEGDFVYEPPGEVHTLVVCSSIPQRE